LITEHNQDVSPEELYLTTDDTHKRQAFIPLAIFEHAIPANELEQIHTFDVTDTETGCVCLTIKITRTLYN
jgi:hypothetical protein